MAEYNQILIYINKVSKKKLNIGVKNVKLRLLSSHAH